LADDIIDPSESCVLELRSEGGVIDVQLSGALVACQIVHLSIIFATDLLAAQLVRCHIGKLFKFHVLARLLATPPATSSEYLLSTRQSYGDRYEYPFRYMLTVSYSFKTGGGGGGLFGVGGFVGSDSERGTFRSPRKGVMTRR
jgi:hypothetical protein